MGNNPSQAIAAAGAKAQFNSAVSDVQSSLGIGNDANKNEVVVPKHIGCANKKEQKQRQKERHSEYEQKQRERTERKGQLESKWANGNGSGGETTTTTTTETNIITEEEKDKALNAKLAALKENSKLNDKNKKKKGFFGSGK